jgi:hypothetical protein
MEAAVLSTLARGGECLNRAIGIKHRKALEQDHADSTHGTAIHVGDSIEWLRDPGVSRGLLEDLERRGR